MCAKQICTYANTNLNTCKGKWQTLECWKVKSLYFPIFLWTLTFGIQIGRTSCHSRQMRTHYLWKCMMINGSAYLSPEVATKYLLIFSSPSRPTIECPGSPRDTDYLVLSAEAAMRCGGHFSFLRCIVQPGLWEDTNYSFKAPVLPPSL